MEIPKRFAEEMIAQALEENPNECCGLLASAGGRTVKLYRIENVEPSRYRYRMKNFGPHSLGEAIREIEERGWQLQVIYHSHTHSEAYPSQTDVRLALWGEGQKAEATWPDTYYALISLLDKANPQIRAFRILDGGVIIEEPVVIS